MRSRFEWAHGPSAAAHPAVYVNTHSLSRYQTEAVDLKSSMEMTRVSKAPTNVFEAVCMCVKKEHQTLVFVSVSVPVHTAKQ